MAQTVARLLCLLLVLLSPAAARPLRVTLESDPAGARITDSYGNFLGRTGTPFELDPSAYGSLLEVTLERPGYEPKMERITLRELQAQGRYPRQGAIGLRPTAWWVPLRTFLEEHRLWAAGALGLAAVAGALGLRRRRELRARLERAEQLEQLRTASRLPPDDPLLLAELGGYRIVDGLGRGGTAGVYRAVPAADLDPSGAVAIKVLHPEVSGDPEFSDRFRREVNLWRTLSHPNIVSLLDWGEEKGRTYLVMELVEGRTLRQRISRRGLPAEQALELFLPVLEAVHYANSRGVIHRDLKPENVMVTPSGKVLVMDFGLARSGEADRLTRTGTFVGTPAYMAPEQIQNHALDPRTDQYALGTMLYEMLSGHTPFTGNDPVQLIFEQVSTQPPPLEKGSPEIARVVARMLSKRPQDRYGDLAEVREALRGQR